MTPRQNLLAVTPSVGRREMLLRFRWGVAVGSLAVVLTLAGCTAPAPSEAATPGEAADEPASVSEPAPASDDDSAAEPSDDSTTEPTDENTQEETCDWDSPRISGDADIPEGQGGVLSEALVGSWQHTHTDEGAGFEEVTNDHRFVFPSSDRMLYCQHVPGVTDHAENAADITLNDTAIEWAGGKYGYTVMAWDEDTMLWDNPVGGGYVYLLQRR